MKKIIDLTGQKFGRLHVVGIYGKRGHAWLWKCLCDCGNERVVLGASLKNGKTRSCGCLQKEITTERSTKHGNANRGKLSSEYISWKQMLDRCTNENLPRYKDYGGRGITVCERWRDFNNFLSDMGRKPSSKHSIERIDNNGNYEPGNCKWATDTEQAINQRIRKDNTTGVKGVYLIRGKWQASIGVDGKLIYVGYFDTKEQAIEARKRAEEKYRKSS